MKNLLLVFYCIFNLTVYAQNIVVTGTVKEADKHSPLSGVTVVIISNEDNKVIGGAISDLDGNFQIKTDIKKQKVFLQLSFVGFETLKIDSLVFKNNKADVGVVSLLPSAISTSIVEIKGQKSMIEYHVDKQVINMEQVPGSQSGSVTDALKNTGIVEVDPASSKISIRGNSNVNILIDGKPQPMADNLLSQMPASYIDKVEVVTTPSAKDDPEGDGGTINFITKKNNMDSYNGSISVYSSSQELGFGNLILNYKKNKLNLFSSANGYFGHMDRINHTERTNYSSSSLHSQLTDGINVMKGYMSSFKLGFDYDLDTMNTFTVTGNYNKTNGKMVNTSYNKNFDNNGLPTYNFSLVDDGVGDFNNYSITGNYKRKFNSSGHEITFDGFYSAMINDMKNNMETDYEFNPGFPSIQKNHFDINNKTYIINSDYVNPSEEYGKVEAGYKYTHRKRTSLLDNSVYSYSTGLYSDVLGLSNTFKYNEKIHALYTAYTNKISIIEYKLGLRVEQTIAEGYQITTNDNFTSHYTSFFPSLGISYKMNDMMQIAFNASRKINRPQLEMVNPFIRVLSPNNIMQGNPKLGPTYVNSYELKFNPILNLYYNTSKGRPSAIMTTIQDSITLNTTINAATTKNYGMELTIPFINEPRFPIKLPSWFQMFTLRLTYNKFIENGGYLTEKYDINRDNWRFAGNFSVNLWEDINAMIYYNVNLKNEDVRYRNSGTKMIGFMLRKDFFDKSLQVTLNISDILNNTGTVNETFGSNFYNLNKTEMWRSRNIGISLRYNFNDFKDRKDKTIDDGRDKSDGGMFK